MQEAAGPSQQQAHWKHLWPLSAMTMSQTSFQKHSWWIVCLPPMLAALRTQTGTKSVMGAREETLQKPLPMRCMNGMGLPMPLCTLMEASSVRLRLAHARSVIAVTSTMHVTSITISCVRILLPVQPPACLCSHTSLAQHSISCCLPNITSGSVLV